MDVPNLILLTVECWRADHFGVLTPHLANLVEESAVFSDAQTTGGWTRISMTALMSSAYASMHGGPDAALATPARTTLAECLLENGFWTGGYTANPVCGSAGGFHRGFGSFCDASRKPPLPPGAPQNWRTEWRRLVEMGVPPRDTRSYVDAGALTDIGLSFLERRRSREPWFLWLHYLDPHWPCQMAVRPSTREELEDAWDDVIVFLERVQPSRGTFDPGDRARERWVRRYRECVREMDTEIGRLLGELRKRPDWDRTIVAVTGDHGEEMFERGTWHHSWNQLHCEGVHVPLILRVPGGCRQSISRPAGLIDLAPTLLDFAGVTAPERMIGKSLRPVMEGHARESSPVFTEMMGHRRSSSYRLAIRDGAWKYIYDFDHPHSSKLYRVEEDPMETVNLKESQPSVFRRFEQMRLEHITLGLSSLMERRIETPDPRVEAEASAGDFGTEDNGILREQLEALGYL
jgi:arylsulfatase A-like enzyme